MVLGVAHTPNSSGRNLPKELLTVVLIVVSPLVGVVLSMWLAQLRSYQASQ